TERSRRPVRRGPGAGRATPRQQRARGRGMSADAPRSRLLDLGAGRPKVEVLEAGPGAAPPFPPRPGGLPPGGSAPPPPSPAHHVYAPLLPGFGQSTGLDCLDDQLDLFLFVFDVIDALGLERPYVVGESMGGWIAAEMAALRPKEIGRLALAAPI